LRYARDAAGISVYTLACLNGQGKVAEELIRAGWCWIYLRRPSAEIARAPRSFRKATPASRSIVCRMAATPLHLAVLAAKSEMVVFFAMKGADLSAGPESPLLGCRGSPGSAKATDIRYFY